MMGFGWILVLLVVAAVAFGVGWRPRFGQPSESEPVAVAGGSKDPLDILRERYARGEISRDEYRAMQQDLRG